MLLLLGFPFRLIERLGLISLVYFDLSEIYVCEPSLIDRKNADRFSGFLEISATVRRREASSYHLAQHFFRSSLQFITP